MSNSFKRYASEQYVDEQLSKIHLDWESIQNKPFEAEQVFYEWDDDLEYESVYSTQENAYFEKISEDTPALNSLIGKYLYLKATIANDNINDKVLINTNLITAGTEETPTFTIYYYFIVVKDSLTIQDITLSKGIWIMNSQEEGDNTVDLHKIQILNPSVPIDESVLPTTAQSDWNENDSTKFSYIKNKPFGVDRSSFEELLDMSSTTWQNASGVYSTRFRGSAFPLIVGDNGIVVVDGTMYSGVVEDLSHIQSGCLGFGDTAELAAQDINQINFLCYAVGTKIIVMVRTNTMPTECKLGTGTEIIKKIDEKYLPDSFKPTWDNIQDNPLLVPAILYEWDDNIVYEETAPIPDNFAGTNFAKISDNPILSSEIIGTTLTVTGEQDGTLNSQSIPITEDFIYLDSESGYAVSEILFVVLADSYTFENGDISFTLSKGVWVGNDYTEDDGIYIKSLKVTGNTYDTLIDEKYISSTIARVDDIPTLTATDDGAGNVTLSFN